MFELILLSISCLALLFTLYMMAVAATYQRASRLFIEAASKYHKDSIKEGDELVRQAKIAHGKADRMSFTRREPVLWKRLQKTGERRW